MTLTVFVERIDDDTFRAETSQPFSLSAEGGSRDEAVERLRELAQQRLSNSEVIQIEIPGWKTAHPWLPFAGIWKDNPDVGSFLENIAEYRREIDDLETGK